MSRETLIERWLTNQQFHPIDIKATLDWYKTTNHEPANSEIRLKALEFADKSKAKWIKVIEPKIPLWQISAYAFAGSLGATIVADIFKWLMK